METNNKKEVDETIQKATTNLLLQILDLKETQEWLEEHGFDDWIKKNIRIDNYIDDENKTVVVKVNYIGKNK